MTEAPPGGGGEEAASPATALPDLLVCSPSKKERLTSLVKAYFHQLQTGCGYQGCKQPYCASSRAFLCRGQDATALFSQARNCAKDAFREPEPVFRFCPTYCYPTKALPLELLTADAALQIADDDLEPYLKRTFNIDTAPWAFLSVNLLRRGFDIYDDEREVAMVGGGCLGIDLPVIRKNFRKLDNTAGMKTAVDLLVGDIEKRAAETGPGSWRALLEAEKPVVETSQGTEGECVKLNQFLTWRLARLFVLLFECPTVVDTTSTFSRVCVALATLNRYLSPAVVRIWANYTADRFYHVIAALQTHITLTLLQESFDGEGQLSETTIHVEIPAACIMLSIFFEANYLNSDEGIVSYKQFYNDVINERISAQNEFERWCSRLGSEVKEEKLVRRSLQETFFNAARWYREEFDGISRSSSPFVRFPFLLNATFKHVLLQCHSRRQQNHQMRQSLISTLIRPDAVVSDENLYLVLNVDRHQLIQTTLLELNRKKDRMRRPLRVQFKNEDGIDEGGVKKEFFQLVIRQLVDPSYGMFTENEDTRTHWFQPRIICSQNDIEYLLIGKMVGLAIYNQVILDINFPRVAYKKLLNIEPSLSDLKGLDPDLHHSFQILLRFDEEKEGATVEETFCRNFSVTHDVFGEKIEVELKPGGKDVPLTIANRKEYVELYTKYLFHDSIGKNFDEFQDGFFEVCGMQGELLKTFHPEELEQMVVGCPVLDLTELEETTRYAGGFTPSDELIKQFWSIVRDMTPEEQRAFLKFTTGTDRLPLTGLKGLNFVVFKNGGDSDQLPTAHTCFNHLLLPDYSTKEKLKEKLLKAISNCQGFGLM